MHRPDCIFLQPPSSQHANFHPVTPSAQSKSFQPAKLILCLLAASLFWLLNALNKTGYSRNVKYPIQFVYDDSLYIPTAPLPQTITLNLVGSGWYLFGQAFLPFQNEPIKYVVNNPLRAKSINTSVLAEALDEQAKNLRVNYIVADTFELGFDRRTIKTIHLVADSLHLNMAPRHVVTSLINITPNTLTVEGPAKLLRGVSDTLVVRIPGQRISQNYDEELSINHFKHPLLKVSTEKVFVSFEVGELLSVQP